MADQFWEEAAQTDPLWAILSDPAKRNRGWTVAEFFETGRRETSLLLHQLHTLGHSPRHGAALDFGCGVGRLSQAMAATFEAVTGVDVSPTMIRLAQELNRHPGRVRYVCNEAPDLSLLSSRSLDFLYSDIVLQHIPPAQSRVFIAEFLRTLRPGGIAVFQLTAERRGADVAAAARVVAMPDAGYRARITVEGLPARMEPGDVSRLVVTVDNVSPHGWSRSRHGVVRVGNHWRDAVGAMLIQDDGRSEVGDDLAPAETRRLALTVTAPSEPGRYVCEVDVVHEGVTWFGDRGSTTWRGDVAVGAARGAASVPASAIPAPTYPDIYGTLGTPASQIGEFPMYGVPRAEVEAILTANGGRVFHVEPDERGAPEWSGYRYFVVNAAR